MEKAFPFQYFLASESRRSYSLGSKAGVLFARSACLYGMAPSRVTDPFKQLEDRFVRSHFKILTCLIQVYTFIFFNLSDLVFEVAVVVA